MHRDLPFGSPLAKGVLRNAEYFGRLGRLQVVAEFGHGLAAYLKRGFETSLSLAKFAMA